METYNFPFLENATLQSNVIIVLSWLMIVCSLLGHFYPQAGKKWYTPFRILVTLSSVFNVFCIYMMATGWNSVPVLEFLLIVIAQIALLVFLLYSYRVGKVWVIVRPLFSVVLIVVSFLFVLFSFVEDMSRAPQYASSFNEIFLEKSQEEKNEYYTVSDLRKLTGVSFPEFDVIEYTKTAYGPDTGYTIVLHFKSKLQKSIIEELDKLCETKPDKWKKEKKNQYFFDGISEWPGDGVYIDVKTGRIRIFKDLH